MITSMALTGFLATYIAMETYSLGVERLIIKDPLLPKKFHNLRVVFISDLHHGTFSSQKRLRLMVKKINDLKPDLILLGGDYLQTNKLVRTKQTKALKELGEILRQLQSPPLGIFGVLGNHDHYYAAAEVTAELTKAGIQMIDNQGLSLEKDGDRIFLAGVGDLWLGKPNLEAAVKNRQGEKFTLLLSHQPNFIDQLTKEDKINFVLAGHTHGSQFSLLGYQPIAPRSIARWEYMSGLVETAQARMLVSPGIGNVAPYFRFFAPPKIHLLVFKSSPRLEM